MLSQNSCQISSIQASGSLRCFCSSGLWWCGLAFSKIGQGQAPCSSGPRTLSVTVTWLAPQGNFPGVSATKRLAGAPNGDYEIR